MKEISDVLESLKVGAESCISQSEERVEVEPETDQSAKRKDRNEPNGTSEQNLRHHGCLNGQFWVSGPTSTIVVNALQN